MMADSGSLRLSAVIPNFNHGSVIGEAIRAIAEQEPAADEIIVVDDGSTDNSIEILQRLCREFPRLRVIRLEENQGAIHALNRGLQEARGKYVNFGAADDLTRPGLFAAMLAALNSHPQAAFACCEAAVVDVETGRTAYRPPVRPGYTCAFFEPAEVVELLRRIDNWILSGTALVRRDVASNIGGFDPTLGAFGDGFLFRKLALRHGFCFVPQLGLTWRVSAKGLSRSGAASFAISTSMRSLVVTRMRADPDFPPWYIKVFERRWRFAVGRIAASARPMDLALLTKLDSRAISRAIMMIAAAVGGPIGRFAALSWLALQYRPTSIVGLIRTGLARYCSTGWRNGH
jgi:hypothetical protein